MNPMDAKEKCTAKAKQTGERCGNWPVPGAKVCRMHGGKAPQVAAKAAARRQEQAVSDLLQNLGTPTPINPVQALLDLIAAKHGEVVWLRAVVQDMARADLAWGTSEHEHGQDPKGRVDKYTDKAAVSVWWAMLHKAEDQLAGYASQALRAGIEERSIRLAEGRGQIIVGAIQKILAGLKLTVDQQILVPDLVAQAFRELSPGGGA